MSHPVSINTFKWKIVAGKMYEGLRYTSNKRDDFELIYFISRVYIYQTVDDYDAPYEFNSVEEAQKKAEQYISNDEFAFIYIIAVPSTTDLSKIEIEHRYPDEKIENIALDRIFIKGEDIYHKWHINDEERTALDGAYLETQKHWHWDREEKIKALEEALEENCKERTALIKPLYVARD